jgi:DNA helicase HerA-like ATPase
MSEPILIAQKTATEGNIQCFLRPDKANRHGLITGATGTGKTITLQTMAEGFSNIGVPVFMADVKGDLSGISQVGNFGDKLAKVIKERGIATPDFKACPTTLWDVFGESGHPVRATISDLGPLLLSRMLNLNETQAGVLQLVFKIADDQGMLLLDMKDLRAMCQAIGDNASDYTTSYGNISPASIGAIQRGLLQTEAQGGDKFFGEPMLNIADFMQTDASGKGVINILAADKLLTSPRLYATFLLWMLSELFETLPEVGDLDQPKLVFFFDEAHLLFTDAPKVLLERIELVVRLVRSKGVGVYFVTQNPLDIPDSVLAQLGNRVQHALRAFTAKDQKDLKMASETYRPNPRFDTQDAIRDVGTGEALTSFLEEKGIPGIVERTLVRPPASQLGPIDASLRAQMIAGSVMRQKYEVTLDRNSAYEILRARSEQAAQEAAAAEAREDQQSAQINPEFRNARRYDGGSSDAAPRKKASSGRSDSITETFAKSFVRSLGSKTGQAVIRGVLGSIFRSR